MKKTLPDRPAGGGAARKAPFPGGASSGPAPALRVAFDRAPMADLIAHAALSSEVEVGGVLVGYLGEDATGRFVHVQAVIRAEQAREQGAHVTFTHDTWNHIHREMDSRHRGLEIVGWYHTHPGFGVFLSEMDSFIHENFFNQPHHVALVYDPLSGRMCMCVLRDSGLVLLDRYWRDGREVTLQAGRTGGPEAGGAAAEGGVPGEHDIAALREALRRVEALATAPRRSWIEDWLTPILLLAILLLGIHGFLTNREQELTRIKADLFDQIQMYAEQGRIRILDLAGREVRLEGIDPRLDRATPRPAPRREPPPAPPRQGGPDDTVPPPERRP